MYLLFALLFGIACALIANSKGRNGVGWFLIGFFLGLIGLIICLCMSNLNEERQYRDQQAEENRRLREKLRQEQLKLESLRQHTAERLDRHDRALNMDTRQTEPSLLGSGLSDFAGGSLPAGGPQPAAAGSFSLDSEPTEWYFVDQGAQNGPVTIEQMHALIRSGVILPDTLIWEPAMPAWARACSLPRFAPAFF